MERKIANILQSCVFLLLVVTLVCGHELHKQNETAGEAHRWLTSQWSECSATCGGGVRSRSVRCLDKDGVISRKCSSERPEAYQLCNQINCDSPGVADPNLLPYDGDHTLMGADGSIHLIEFQSHSEGYQITQTTIESDETTTLLSERVTPTDMNGTFTIQPCRYNLNVRIHHRFKGGYLAMNGKKLIQLNAKSVTVQTEDRLTYFDSAVSITGKNGYSFSNITTLWYHDTLCFHSFKNRKSEPLFGPGTLFIGNRLGLYSTSSELSGKVQALIEVESDIDVVSSEEQSSTEDGNKQHREQGSMKRGSAYTNKKRVRRQTAAWTLSEWSECSATCGGGIRARSLRCLDDCGIISDCNETRPTSYEFCARNDCITDMPDINILPPNGTVVLMIPGGAESIIEFKKNMDRYELAQNTTEVDGTVSVLMETQQNDPPLQTISFFKEPADVSLSLQPSNGQTNLVANGEVLLVADCVETTQVQMGIMYEDDTVTVIGPGTEFPNTTILWYHDGFRFYMFNNTKDFQFPSSGKLFTSKNVAIYSTSGKINTHVENLLQQLPLTTSTQIMSPTTMMIATSTITPLPTTTIVPTCSSATTITLNSLATVICLLVTGLSVIS